MALDLPDQPLLEATVDSLTENDTINNSMVLCGIGMGETRRVIQFLIETDKAVYVLCLAAPDDELHDGWFKLETLEHRPDNRETLVIASEAAAEYSETHNVEKILEDFFGLSPQTQTADVEFTLGAL